MFAEFVDRAVQVRGAEQRSSNDFAAGQHLRLSIACNCVVDLRRLLFVRFVRVPDCRVSKLQMPDSLKQE